MSFHVNLEDISFRSTKPNLPSLGLQGLQRQRSKTLDRLPLKRRGHVTLHCWVGCVTLLAHARNPERARLRQLEESPRALHAVTSRHLTLPLKTNGPAQRGLVGPTYMRLCLIKLELWAQSIEPDAKRKLPACKFRGRKHPFLEEAKEEGSRSAGSGICNMFFQKQGPGRTQGSRFLVLQFLACKLSHLKK